MSNPPPTAQTAAIKVFNCGAVVAKVSLKGKEDALRSALATQWVAMTRSLAQASPVLKELIGRSDGQLTFLFSDRSGTLQRHLSGWKRWLEFCRCGHISVEEPVLSQVLDFPDALATGARPTAGLAHQRHC